MVSARRGVADETDQPSTLSDEHAAEPPVKARRPVPVEPVALAAGFVCVVFAGFVLIHLVWAAGDTWGLEDVSGVRPQNPNGGLTVASLIGATAVVGVIVVTLARVGWLTTPFPARLVRLGAGVAFAWPAIGSLNPFDTWEQRAVTVPLAMALLVVARWHPQSQGPTALTPQRPPGTTTKG